MTLLDALAAAALTGLLGNLHCAAMCGPLAVAGCARDGCVRAAPTAGYFAGRFVSYATAGALFGHAGAELLRRLPVQAVQTVAAVLIALVALGRGVALLRRGRSRVGAAGPRPVSIGPARAALGAARPLLARFAALLPRRGLGLGLATGLLPCGLFVPAWLLAGASGSAPAGALVMFVFALATLPGLIVPLAGRRLLARLMVRLPPSAPALAWCLLAVWIAARPLLAPAGACH